MQDYSRRRRGESKLFPFLFLPSTPPPSSPPPPSPSHHHPTLATGATTERQFPEIDKIWKERSYVGHSFIFSSSRGLILNSEAVSKIAKRNPTACNTTHSLACDHQLVDYKSKLKAQGHTACKPILSS